MRKIRLLRLKIENFRGIKDLQLQFEGNDKVLAGTNEVGKTTVADGFSWLISDKDSKGNSQFEIKPLDEDNEPIHHLNSIVEGAFQIIKDGNFEREFVLKKDYYEKWTRKRGTTTEKFSGHTTDYYIDDVPEKKSDYEDFIDNIIDYDTLKLITDPMYFNEQLHWNKQRDIIFKLVDRPDPGEVAAEIEKYYLAEKLENTTIEKYQKKLKSKMKKINDRLKEIPARIDEVNKSLKNMDAEGDEEKIQKNINKLNERLEQLQEKKAELKTESKSSTMKQIIDLKSELQGIKEDKLEKANKKLNDYKDMLAQLDRAKISHESRINNLERTIKMQEERKQRALKEKDVLLKEYHKFNNQSFSEDDKVCSSCGQELPQNRINEIKSKMNKEKSNKLADIKTKGKKKAKVIDEAEDSIEEAVNSIKKIQEQIDSLEYEPVEAHIKNGEEYKEKLKDNELPELKELADKITELEDKDVDGEPLDLTDVNKEISDTKFKIKKEEKILSKLESKEQLEKRIEQLQEEEQTLINNYEQFERNLYDLEKYIKFETEMMEEEINNKFSIAKFKLFDRQVNGAVNETCEAMKNGVPYSELNTGSQYQVGMDIINTLAEHYGISAPIFIDNRERIARMPEVESQTIQLVMTPARKKLEMINLANEDDVADFVEAEAGIEQESLF